MNQDLFKKIKDYFLNKNEAQYFFISGTNFNLMNMHQWVKNWHDYNIINCYDDNCPSVNIPHLSGDEYFNSIEDINQFILASSELKESVAKYNKKNSSGNHALF